MNRFTSMRGWAAHEIRSVATDRGTDHRRGRENPPAWRILGISDQRAPDGFDEVTDRAVRQQLEEIVANYKRVAGFTGWFA